MTPITPITMSINDATKLVGLGRTTIYKLIEEGRIETIRIGRRTLCKVASLQRLVDDL